MRTINSVQLNEEWREIKGYEGLYEVSNIGRIKSLVGWDGHKYIRRDKILNPYKQEAGKDYYRSVVRLYKNRKKKQFKVHRLVAIAFIPNLENKPNINHIDGNPFNNKVNNLEWCTQKENVLHAIDSELNIRVVDTFDRESLVQLLNNEYTYDDIAGVLGVSKVTVFNYIKKFNIKKIYQ